MIEKLKNFNDLKKEWKTRIINESTIQEAVTKYGGIEFSYTGELIPFEVVEGGLRDEAIKWVKHIREDIKTLEYLWVPTFYSYRNTALRGLDEVLEGQVVWIINFFNLNEKEIEPPHCFIEDDICANKDLEKMKKKDEK